jgi:photosystem II stability/assembly factor-like uncharacterized protein
MATEFIYHWGHPSPQGNIVYNMAFADANSGLAVTGCGQMLKTTDGGETWELILGPDEECSDLYDIVRSPEGTLITSGDNGRIMRSTNAGESFQTFTFPEAGRLYDLCLIPGGGISAAGQNGSVLISFDDGISWIEKGPGGTGYARHHLWKTSSEGYVVGSDMFYRTTDGGNSWTQVAVPGAFGLNEIYFVSDYVGYAIEDFAFWKTTDGGDSWIQEDVFTSPLYRFRTVVLDELHWFTVTFIEGGELWETIDGGENWENRMYYTSAGFPCLVKNGNRMLFGSDLGDIFFTDDGGTNIQNATQNLAVFPSAPITIIGTRPDGTLFANNQPNSGTDNGTFYRSDDGGFSWYIPSQTPGLRWVTDIQFCNNQHGVLGSYNDIRYTTDGGETWGESSLPENYNLTKFALPRQDLYFAGTYSISPYGGNLFLSTDQGATWEVVSGGLPVNSLYVTSLDFANASTGYLAGLVSDQVRIFKTTDGGASWSPINFTGISGFITDMQWLDDNTGIAAVPTTNSGIFRTSDGGQNWTKVSEASSRYLSRTIDDRIAAISPGDTFFQESTDGGLTWESYSPPFSSSYPGYSGYVESVQVTDEGYILGGIGNRLMVAEIDVASGLEADEDGKPSDQSERIISVLPNPVNNNSIIRLNLEVGSDVTLRMYDLHGRLVHTYLQQHLDDGIHEVPAGSGGLLRSLKPGIYLLVLQMESGLFTAKLIK